MPQIETLVRDMYAVLDERNDHVVNEDNVEYAGEMFKQMLRTRYTKRVQKTGEGVLRFSSLGKKDRQLYYAANNPDAAEILPPKTLLKFQYGDMLEILLIFLAKEAGHEVSHEQQVVEADGVKGSMDCVIDGVVTDVKSASPYSYRKFEDNSLIFDDSFGYISQLSGYANSLSKLESNPAYTERAGFLVADKVSGSLCFSEIDGLTIQANPPEPRIKELREALSSKAPPPRCYAPVPEGTSGNMKLPVGCSYCSFKDLCWSDANGGKGLRKFWYSTGPKWLTSVSKEPKVPEAV